jgi:hypothetical protein
MLRRRIRRSEGSILRHLGPQRLALAAMALAMGCAACGTSASVPSAAPPTPSPTPAGGAHEFRVPGLPLAVTADLPPGWAADGPMMTRSTSDEGTLMSISVWVVKQVYRDPCSWSDGAVKVRPSADALADALELQHSRQVRRTTVSVGDHTAHFLTLHVPDDADFATCDQGEFRSWSARGGVARVHEGPDQVDEVYIIDLGRERRVVVDAAYFPDIDSEELGELHRIVSTLEFTRGR